MSELINTLDFWYYVMSLWNYQKAIKDYIIQKIDLQAKIIKISKEEKYGEKEIYNWGIKNLTFKLFDLIILYQKELNNLEPNWSRLFVVEKVVDSY